MERLFTGKTYIVCWDKSFSNCLVIDAQLAGSVHEYLVYNVSATDVDKPNWVCADDVRYYGHFRNALRDFVSSEHDVFIFNAGDIVHGDYASYTTKILDLFESDSGVGAFAPNMTNDAFSGNGSYIIASTAYPGMSLATHTNGVYTSLSRDIAETLNEFMDWAEKTGTIDWSTMRSGWGLDTVYCALVVYLGKKIYRDSSVRFFHYEGTSYDWGPAGQEMVVVMDAFKVFCASRDMDPERVQRIYDIAYDKVRTHRALSVSDVYLNHAPSLVI